MPPVVYAFDDPERFVAGTVGAPGERVFFLQARDGSRVVSVALEKAQVAALAEQIVALLEEVRRQGDEVSLATGAEDLAPLDAPVEEEFRVAALVLGWDGQAQRVFIEARSTADVEVEETEDEPAVPWESVRPKEGTVLRVRLTAAAALAFGARARRVVAAGRPPCPICGLPMDPSGHVCPRQNGHRA